MRRLVRRILGWLFDRLYHELAFSYDFVSSVASGGRWRGWQQAVLPYVRGPRVLEIGPGTGHLLAELWEQGYDAYAVERSPAMAWRTARLVGLGRVIRADARQLPFAAATFDTVLGTFPSLYVLEDIFAAEVARVLRPGGRLVLLLGAESGVDPWPGWIERFLRWSTADAGAPTGSSALRYLAGKHFYRETPTGRLSMYVAERRP